MEKKISSLHPAQRDVFFDQLINIESPHYNTGGYIKLIGLLDRKILKDSASSVAEAFDALKMRFNFQSSEPELTFDEEYTKFEIEEIDFTSEGNPSFAAALWVQNRFNIPFRSNGTELLFEQFLLKVSENEHWLYNRYHHIVLDGYSLTILAKYIADTYNALARGALSSVCYPTYKDEINRASTYYFSENYAAEGAYWKEKIKEIPRKIFTPRYGCNGRKGKSGKKVIVFDSKRRLLLDDIQTQTNCSIQQLCIAALIIYFGQSTRESQFIFGIPVHKRTIRSLRNVVGMFSGVIPFKGSYKCDTILADSLKAIKNSQKGDYRYQNYLISDLNKSLKNSGGDHLFDVIINYELLNFELDFGHELQATIVQISSEYEQTPVRLSWRDFGKQQPLELHCDYLTEYFSGGEIDFLLGNVVRIIEHFHNGLEKTLAEFSRLPSGENGYLLDDISKSSGTDYSSIRISEKRSYYPLSPAQKRLYFLQQFTPGIISYNLPVVLALSWDVGLEKLERAFAELVRRHESFRTNFITVGNEVVQRISDSSSFKVDHLTAEEWQLEEIIKNYIRPFDLSTDCLLRACAVRGGQSNLLLVDMHHIISDRVTSSILQGEFLSLLESEVLRPLKYQYRDFSQWQNGLISGGAIARQEKYWLELYEGAIPRLDLSTDYRRPEVFSFQGDIYELTLEKKEAEALKLLGDRLGATLYMNMLALLNTLFYKYTGQEDIIIGCSVAGRPHADLQGISGMFVNTLAMRSRPTGEKRYEDFLKEVAQASIEAFENQDVQFEDLVEKLNLPRDPSRNSLFDVSMIVQNFDKTSFAQSGSRSIAEMDRKAHYKNATSKFDMTFSVHEEGGSIAISIEYYSAIFSGETIQRLAAHFKNLIVNVTENSKIRIKDIDILTPKEKHQLLQDFNDTATNYPKDKTVIDYFEAQVQKAPNNIAVIFEDHCLSYELLNSQSNRLAHLIKEKLLVGNRSHNIGLLMDRSANLICAILAILKAGGTYVPLDIRWPTERVREILFSLGISSLISEYSKLRTIQSLQADLPALTDIICLDVETEKPAPEKLNYDDTRLLWDHLAESSFDRASAGGFLNSYTSEYFKESEIDQYQKKVIELVEPYLNSSTNVLEVGCGSGEIMFALAPWVKTYTGLDPSKIIQNKNYKYIIENSHKNIHLLNGFADEIDSLTDRKFDVIIVASTVQFFPGYLYLEAVTSALIKMLTPGGIILFADILDARRKETFAKSILEYSGDVERKRKLNKDLLYVDEDFFNYQVKSDPEIADVIVFQRNGQFKNELDYRYDVLVKKGLSLDQDRIVASFKRNIWTLWHINQYSSNNLNVKPDEGQFVYIIHTSGSTGVPKGVAVGHQPISNLVDWVNNKFEVSAADRLLFTASICFDLSVYDIFGILSAGASIHVVNEADILNPDRLVDILFEEPITFWNSAPAVLQQCTSFFNRGNLNPSSPALRLVFLSGDWIKLGLPDIVKSTFPKAEVICLGGATEATVWSNWFAVNSIDPNWVSIPYGKPIQNSFYYILDKDLNVCPIGVIGDLYIGGDCLSSGYINDPTLTSIKFIQDPYNAPSRIYATGDKARYFADGNIEFLGRVDNQVKIRGYRIELGEIESALEQSGMVQEGAVIVRKDSEGENQLVGYFIPRGNVNQFGIQEYLRLRLPEYMVPSIWVSIEFLPLTSNGKVNKKALPDPEFKADKNYGPARNEVERKLIRIWSEVLGIELGIISVYSNFFGLGGHSLKASVLVARIHKIFGVKVALRQIFQRQTIASQSEFILQSVFIAHGSLEIAEKKEYYPVSSAQKRLYFLHQFDVGNTSYNMPWVLRLTNGMSYEKLQFVFQQLVSRHESFRTSFVTVGEEVVQRILDATQFELDCSQVEEAYLDQAIRSYVRPFDLAKDVLLRACLFVVGGQSNVLVVDMHHIISDGTTSIVLEDDFAALVREEVLPVLKYQYKDFSEWQKKLRSSDQLKRQEQYWLNLFRGDIPRLNLQTDHKRPETFSFQGHKFYFTLDGKEAQSLRSLGLRLGVTLYMNMLAMLNVLFYRYTGQEDIIIGCAIAGRPHADFQRISGMFVNTLAMRNSPSGGMRYGDFLREVKAGCIEAFENQDVQFEDLVEKLNVQRDAGRNPLFDVNMVVQNFIERKRTSILTSRPAHGSQYDLYQNATSNFDMTFRIFEEEDCIDIEIEYYSSVFSRNRIERLSKHFRNIVNAITQNPDTLIKDIEILTAGEKRQLLHGFNNTTPNYNPNKTVLELFADSVTFHADNIALIIGNAHLTYFQLNQRANQVAHYLTSDCKVRTGENVGVYMERSMEQIISILGILKSGASFVPLDVTLPEQRVKAMVDDSNARILISQKSLVRELNRLQWDCKKFETYVCLDSIDIHREQELTQNSLMDVGLWDFVADKSVDDIEGGGWRSSYTNLPFSRKEMDEYGDNAFHKILPLITKSSRVLEIGCSFGITMFRIAPHVGVYFGTDLSEVIVEKNRKVVSDRQFSNIQLKSCAAHEVKDIDEEFDLVIINSVVQSFHGHNYLRAVIEQCIQRIGEEGHIFLGDIMDLDLKNDLVKSLFDFKSDTKGKYETKIDFSAELFVSKGFFRDLIADLSFITDVEFSNKIHTVSNELTTYRYDVLIKVDKRQSSGRRQDVKKAKQQHDLSRVSVHSVGNIDFIPNPNDIAYVMYTSGTTGVPKGVVIEHKALSNYVMWASNHYVNNTISSFAFHTSLSFDLTLTSIFVPLVSGGCIRVYPQSEREIMLTKVIADSQCELVKFTPSHLKLFLSESVTRSRHSDVRWKFVIGGEQLEAKLANELLQKYPGSTIYNEYGPTEATVGCIMYEYSNPLGVKSNIPIGRPIDNTQIYILDKDLNLLPIGVSGELYIGGAPLAKGYLNNASLTSQKFISNFFDREMNSKLYKTGDMAMWLADGNLEYLGRVDDQVKIRGYRIELSEIEQVVQQFIKSDYCAVVTQDMDGYKRLIGYIGGVEHFDKEEIQHYLKAQLPEYMVPSLWVELKEMPLTNSGKINKMALPRPGGKNIDIANEFNYCEEKIVEIWCEILDLDGSEIRSVDANFFDLGGHSLLAITLVRKLHKTFEVKLELKSIFNCPTIKQISELILAAAPRRYLPIPVADTSPIYPLSSAQRRLYFLQKFNPESTSYNMSGILPVNATLTMEQIQSAFLNLIARHESLRTRFVTRGDEIVQQICHSIDFKIVRWKDGGDLFQIMKKFISPFDLSKGILLRACLVEADDKDHVLIIDIHHIISDGISLEILKREFASLCAGETLPPQSLQYKDYAVWINSKEYKRSLKKQEEYWLRTMSGSLPSLRLPVDYKRPGQDSDEGATANVVFDATQTSVLRSICKSEQVTLTMVLGSVLSIMLSKLCGQEDVIIGLSTAGRPHPDLEKVVGMFINSIALRSKPSGEKSCRAYIQELKQATLLAYENEEYQFDDLVDALRIKREASRNPVFDVMLNVLNYRDYSKEDINDEEVFYGHREGVKRFDLTLNVTEYGEKVVIGFQYWTKLFKPGTIDNFIRYFKNIAASLGEGLEKPIRSIQLLSEQDLLNVFNKIGSNKKG